MEIKQAWVTIAAVEFERSVNFYRQLLSQDPIMLTPSYAEFRAFGLSIGIYRPKHEEATPPITLFPSVSLCLQVEDLEGAIADLAALDAFVGEIRFVSHGREAYAYDPDGNRIILYQPD